MVKKTEAVTKAAEKKNDNVFVNFYDVETKTSYVFNIDVSKVDKLVLRQRYDRDKDRHTTILELPGKDLCITPRLDKLGHLSTYMAPKIESNVKISTL